MVFLRGAIPAKNRLADAQLEDYMFFRRAMGFDERKTLCKLVFANTLPLFVTVMAFAPPFLILGTMLAEEIFSLRGIGEWYLGWAPAQLLFGMALFWIIPLWMAFLSVTLKGTVNRWLNIIVGALFTILNIWHITQPCCIMIHQILVVLSTIIAATLVVYFAWIMPKKKD